VTISAEELRSRIYSRSTTDPEDRRSCEQCGAINLIPRTGRGPAEINDAPEPTDAPYRCEQCGEFVEGSA